MEMEQRGPNIIWSVVTAEAEGTGIVALEAGKEHERASGDFDSGREPGLSPGLLLILDVLRNRPGGTVNV